MTQLINAINPASAAPTENAAKSGERLQSRNEPDPFPPEGTDEKMVRPEGETERPFSDEEATAATRAALSQTAPD